MKIGIITVYDSITNYGSFLQAYALSRVLEQKGHSIYFIRRMSDDDILERFNQLVVERCTVKSNIPVKSILLKAKYKMIMRREIANNIKRFETLKNDWNHLNIISKEDIEKVGLDLIICGSDEIWNIHNKDIDIDFYGCGWIKNISKIAYAISSGDTKTDEFLSVKSWKEQIGDFDVILPRDTMTQKMSLDYTGIESPIVCDPTILRGYENYTITDCGKEFGKYMLVYSYQLSKIEKKYIKKYAKENNLKIISPCVYSIIADENIYTSALDFPSLIANAECVYTTTFHGTIFSLMFAKRMCSSPRFPKILNLLEQVNGENYLLPNNASYEQFKAVLDSKADKNIIFRALKKMQENGAMGLDNALECVKKNRHNPIGASYKDNVKYYYGFSKDEETVRSKSSSGGLFYELSKAILDKGGVVFGARYNKENNTVEHASTDEVPIHELMKSKYLESKIGDTFQKIGKNLEEGRFVLFCGTPCQAAGLSMLREKKYYKHKDHLFIIDFLCEGVPSYKVFNEYVACEEKKSGKKIDNVDFRSKFYGWNNHCMKINYLDKSSRVRPAFADSYMHTFIIDLVFNRPSCYDCPFRTEKKSDITIGDFWKVGKVNDSIKDNRGVSAIFVNSDNGEALLDQVKNQLVIEELSTDNIKNMVQLLDLRGAKDRRNAFYDEFAANGYEAAIKKYSTYFNNSSFIKKAKFLKRWIKMERRRKSSEQMSVK
ncbi:Coenzyme F420 hydrogenase/dehydrogenase, beta subunit C-terminal domain [Butyrivibrio sp. MC2021]|uniref:Coenzyme F420 hydrogenase/dehydrogenase, beta subunit C-terminal domain n=1 Tax=Butyrivibrio sp. MC2021 TaxID=1408306 RepID=UPI00047C549B|nr:Coenzyme F420 hydrogenase/dehydrogenase, beta subunit C-terminal domain [Butyrivibrio sp. MC2021]